MGGRRRVNSYKSTKVFYFLSILVRLQPTQFNLLQWVIIPYQNIRYCQIYGTYGYNPKLITIQIEANLNLASKN